MPLTTFRLASVRLRHHWPLAVAQLMGLAAAVALAVTVPLVQATAAEAGLRSVVEQLGSKRFVTVEQLQVRSAAAYDAFQAEAAARTRRAAGSRLRPAARFVVGPQVTPFQLNDRPFSADDTPPDIASWEGLADHVRVVAGTLPADARDGALYPVAVSAEGAHDFGYALDDRVCFAVLRGISFCTRIAALYEPRDAADPYWGGSLPNHSLMFGRGQYWGLVDEVNARLAALPPAGPFAPPARGTLLAGVAGQAWVPDPGRLHAGEMTDFAFRLNQLRGYFAVQREGLFLTGLDAGVRDFGSRYAVASSTIQATAAGLLLVALYALYFVGAHFFEGQVGAMAALRGRGWSRLRVWRLLMTEVAILALAGVPAGLVTAYLLAAGAGRVAFGGSAPRLGAGELAALAPFAAAAVAAALAVLGAQAAAISRRGVLEVRRETSRAQGRPWWQWRHLDLVLALLAPPLLFSGRLWGAQPPAGPDSAGTGLLGLAAPAAALAVLAVAALRLLPLAARLVGLTGRGLPADLAAWQLTRQPARSARLAILLSLTVAVGTFSAIHAATEQRNAVDRAGYAAGADVRAAFTGLNQTPPNLDAGLSRLPAGTITSTVFRGTATPGRSNLSATLLGIDAGTFPDVAWTRGDLAGEPLDRLTQRLLDADPDGLLLPGRPSRLALWTFSSGLSATITADVIDAAGQHCGCVLGDLTPAGEHALSTALDFPRAPRFPLHLRGLHLSATGTQPAAGEVAVGDLEVTGGGTAAGVEPFSGAGGWWQETLGRASPAGDLEPSARHPRAGSPTVTIDARLVPGTPLILRPPPTTAPVPAIVAADTLSQLGVGLGQPFPMHVDEVVVTVAAVATVDYFPTLYPGRDRFLVVPRETLLARLGHEHNSLAWPNEAWIRVPGSAAPIERALSQAPGLVDLEDRRAATASALGDPLRLSLRAALAIGFAAALAMAVVGFGLHFLVASRTRLSEYAILQANGLPHRLVARSLAAEQVTLLLHGLVVGAVLAVALAVAVLPSVHVSADPADLIPPTILTIDPWSIAAVLAAVGALAFAAGQVAARLGGRFRLIDELRLLG